MQVYFFIQCAGRVDSTVRGLGKRHYIIGVAQGRFILSHWIPTVDLYTLHFPYNNNIHMHSYTYPTNRAIGESTQLHCTRLPSLQISEDYRCKITGN